ncbi:hypothetical protein [Burkholderia contaminans]|uniref:Uncharacterized protein n=1 Tax=Burkholderia contaminans TaxID=488447 RepID=A0ABD7YFA3_9BURK|nr:hypothetical protein [Burkholderia contaminans]WFN23324.1 hypothetical protein LXE91_40020 [Burkholderia contaminans]
MITFDRNDRSPSIGTTDHVQPKSLITLAEIRNIAVQIVETRKIRLSIVEVKPWNLVDGKTPARACSLRLTFVKLTTGHRQEEAPRTWGS